MKENSRYKMKETLAEGGYQYIRNLGYGEHVLLNLETYKYEVWVCNKNHASYGLKFKNTHLEFCRSE